MSNQDSNTKKIAYGELHFYYPFKFDNKYLHENQYNHVGFNDQKDYLNFPPNKNCVFRLPFRLEGTLYNFDFIVREEE